MRTSLFLSTLFAASLLGGTALAEKPAPAHDARTPREPRTVERLRAHGDTVDKAYQGAHGARGSAGAGSTQAPTRGHAPVDRGANRVNCSDTGIDCRAVKGKAQASVGEADAAGGRAARAPAFLDKVLGSDRTNFNEADMDQGMSLRAARRAWASGSTARQGSGGDENAVSLGVQRQVDRKAQQSSEARMDCNEAGECSMSLKAMRKEWAKAAIDAGTWKGPQADPVSNAARRIAEQRAAEGAGASKADKEKAGGKDKDQPHDHAH